MLNNLKNDDAGKLILRITIGALILLHGIAKISNPGSVGWISGQLSAIGLPGFIAYGVYIGEVVAPILILLGFYNRIGALLVAGNMLVAIGLIHLQDVLTLSKTGGWSLELQALFLFAAIAIAFLGSGKYAIKPD